VALSQAPVAGDAARRRTVPDHLGIILDGNRRWAAARDLKPIDGHREGARRLFEAVQWSEAAGVGTLTLWVLSADNLHRSASELAELLPLIEQTIDQLAAAGRWRINHLGRPRILPPGLRDSLRRAANATQALEGMTVNMAVGYDGRKEIVDAVTEAVADHLPAARDQREVLDWEQLITDRLYTCGQKDPDLIIRTSGEQRLSGFMLWQCAWSELYFCNVPWPAFTHAHLQSALESFAARQRRFGR
jgi:short-chain Z-isoprenyl diphosphate synthase